MENQRKEVTAWDPEPCEKENTRLWINEVLGNSVQFTDVADEDPFSESNMFPIIERVLHEIADLPTYVKLGFASDQWVGVSAEATVERVKYETWVEADCFMMALVKTYELWKTGQYKNIGEE